VGGLGNDTLTSGQGKDTLDGGDGNDLLEGRMGGDVLDGGLGDDVLIGNQGKDALAGGDDNDELRGGQGVDTLDGGAGADTLYGAQGADVMTGGEGSDIFVFTTAPDGGGPDVVEDFADGDILQLDSAVFAELAGIADLSGNFVSGDGAVATTDQATLVYDTATSTLYYDADGTGLGEQMAIATVHVTDGSTLDAGDFVVV
jgi:Ca2+-binding RTX toxin-like protein